MVKISKNQKTNLAQLVKSSGFVLLDLLLLICLLQCFLYFAWPSFKTIQVQQHCHRSIFQLESFLEWTSLQASLRKESLLIDLNEELQVKSVQSEVLRRLAIPSIQIAWHSRHELLFHANVLHNHLNGYFLLNCGSNVLYKIWLNRMGHVRVESL